MNTDHTASRDWKAFSKELLYKHWIHIGLSITFSILFSLGTYLFLPKLDFDPIAKESLSLLVDPKKALEHNLSWKDVSIKSIETLIDFKNNANVMVNALSSLLGLVVGLFIAVLFSMDKNIRDINERNHNIFEEMRSLYSLYENLESRHNIIQSGTEFGRVLALRDFKNVDLEAADYIYEENLTKEYCILSTLMLDRAEELLTSATYMSFFIDKTLPHGGYLRLILAREPKSWDGLSTFGTISNQLDYKTVILPLDRWKTICETTLSTLLPRDIYVGLVQLVERNTELGIANHSLESTQDVENFLGATLENTNYCGRIEKPGEKQTDKATIDIFWKDNMSSINYIPEKSIQAFWMLLALFWKYRWLPSVNMKEFEPQTIQSRFESNYSTLGYRINEAFKDFSDE